MAFDQLAPQIIKRLSSDLKLTPQQAAGIVGQLAYESDGLQAINERAPTVPGSRGGFGWAQWTGPRRKQFEQFAQQHKMSIEDPETNYGFLLHELTGTPESRVLDSIRGAQDAQTAGKLFTDKFLRPGVPAYDKRASWTEKAMNFIMPTAQAGTLPEPQAKAPTPWKEVAANPEFQKLSPEDQQRAQQQYFDQVVAPRAPQDQIDAVRSQFFGQYAQEKKPVSQSFGETLMEIPRQIGLTARYGIEGLGQAAQVGTEPIRQAVNPMLRAVGLPEAAATGTAAQSLADSLGLPQPQSANERVIGDAARLMAGAGGIAGGAGALARGASGVTQAALHGFAASPSSQVSSAAGAGLAGGSVREAGGGPLAQGAAALAGGLAAPMAVAGAQKAGQAVMGRVNAMRPTQVLERVRGSLRQSGVDWDTLPARVQNQLQQEAAQAMRSGRDLDPEALRRLADFRMVDGATPTRGMLTQDPGQITREMNLAKMQANTGASGGRNLSQLQADNNTALVRGINQLGGDGADDAVSAGDKLIRSLRDIDKPRKAAVDAAYKGVRDAEGRYAQMDRAAFSKAANDALDENQLGRFLPSEAKGILNDISSGKIPFNVNTAQQTDSVLSGLASDLYKQGKGRQALAVNKVRNALEDTPIFGEAGVEAQEAYKVARGLARDRFSKIDASPALKAALRDVEPDKFVSEFILGSSAKKASVDNVQALADNLRADPGAMGVAKNSIAQWLKEKALSGMPDDIGAAKFSASSFTKALEQIGDRKLANFFSPEEIAQLHALSRVSRTMVNQPKGSAVNNSNTSAALVSRALDMLGGFGKGIKILGIGDQVGAVQSALQQRGAQQIAPALTAPQTGRSLADLLAPAGVYSGILALPPVPPSQDNRRK
ncbi:hypothetical protein H0A71_06600 [Alcaligenaceae bacterium]|nr:hypothetical protein [Alcaligenaceae bacterium]